MRTLAELTALACLIISGIATARANEAIVGDPVVTKYGKAPKDQGRDIEDGGRFRVYVVERSEGDLLLLTSVKLKGWIESSDVLPRAEAVDFYEAEIRKDPENAAAHRCRAWILQNMGDLDGALDDFNASIKLDASVADSYYGRANVYYQRKDIRRATDDASRSVRLDPAIWYVRILSGSLHSRTNEFDEALVDFDEAIRLKPDEPLSFCGRANVWFNKGEFDRVITDSDKAIQLLQGETDLANLGLSYLHRGIAWKQKREYVKAAADLEDSIRLRPKLALPLKFFADILATCPDVRMRDGRKAVEIAKNGYELSSKKDAAYIETLAAAYAESGDFERAIEWQKKAIDLTPLGGDLETKRQERLNLYASGKPYHEP